jgi:hypothetical protein
MGTEHNVINQMLVDLGATVEEVGNMPDGSAFAVAWYPLPQGHWQTAQHFNIPPMPLLMGAWDIRRQRMAMAVEAAGKYAVRTATDNGRVADFDPDALIQHLQVAFFGYYTEDGLSSDEWENPEHPGEFVDMLGEQDPNAAWLSLAHVICYEAGIPSGPIGERLSILRDMIEVMRSGTDDGEPE